MVAHFDDPRLGYLVTDELANDLPLAHHHDPVCQDRQFLDIGRNDDDADAVPRQFANGLVDLLARAMASSTISPVRATPHPARPHKRGGGANAIAIRPKCIMLYASGTTATAWISTLARSSMRAETSIAVIAGK